MMEAKIEEAIEGARKKKPGMILSRDDIYNAIFNAGQKEAYDFGWRTGNKAGIKEVVEWFMANHFDQEHQENGSGYCNYGCPACKLDEQLKKWGIK